MVVNYETFVEALIEEVPELNNLYLEHISDNDEILQHVFMGDVVRFAEQLYESNPNAPCLLNLLQFLEKLFTRGDEKLVELISVSFLENLSREREYYTDFKKLLGKSLRDEAQRYE